MCASAWAMAAKGLPQGESWRAPSVLLLDETGAEDDGALHLAWRSWLHLFNTVQTLPGAWLVTAQGLEQHDYDGLNPSPTSAAAVPAEQSAFNGAWSEALQGVMDPIKPGLIRLAQSGASVPVVGLELADEKGRVIADAELGWGDAKLVLLREDQEDMVEIWAEQGWSTLCLEGDLTMVNDKPWEEAAAAVLGLTIKNKE